MKKFTEIEMEKLSNAYKAPKQVEAIIVEDFCRGDIVWFNEPEFVLSVEKNEDGTTLIRSEGSYRGIKVASSYRADKGETLRKQIKE